MSTYAIGDIHGCYDDFKKMLQLIDLTKSDIVVLLGDYIDRGSDSFSMIKWILDHKNDSNFIFIKGNHEYEFSKYINIIQYVDREYDLQTDISSSNDSAILYSTVLFYLKKEHPEYLQIFDLYGTISHIIRLGGTLELLYNFDRVIQKMPLIYNGKTIKNSYVCVHAGYTDDLYRIQNKYSEENYVLYARDDMIDLSICNYDIVVFGHTPTIINDSVYYNNGLIYKKDKDNTKYFNIDCGAVFRQSDKNGRMACIRIDDLKEYYC